MSSYAHATYCDDIRLEANQKFSLMGVYADTMLLPSLPITLPKLGVLVNAKAPASQPFSGFLIRIHFGDNLLAELEVSKEDYEANRRKAAAGSDHYVQAQFLLSPLQIAEPGKMRITFTSNDHELECNSLEIRMAAEGELNSL